MWVRKATQQTKDTQTIKNAKLLLADCYTVGLGVKQNIKYSFQLLEKIDWYAKANRLESVKIFFNMVQKIPIKGLQETAHQGIPDSQLILAYCYLYGLNNLIQNYKEAVRWFEKAAAQDDTRAFCLLGDCYFFGTGVAQDVQKAREYLEKYLKLAQEGVVKEFIRTHPTKTLLTTLYESK